VWSEQLAFNLMPAEVSGSTLAESLAEVLGGSARVAVRSLQGGIFHGVSASLWVELGSGLQAAEVREAITAGAFVESAEAPQDLGPVAAATTDQILLGEVEKDPSHDGGFWIWAVMDNLTRGGALNAVGVAEELLAPRH
jgi:aspartate-semialdehyde dehydrogenase